METRSSVKVLCGDIAVQEVFELHLKTCGIDVTDEAKLLLLIDKPLGWASLEHPEINQSTHVFVSNNYCPAYQLDLLKSEPLGLLISDTPETVIGLLELIQAGNVVHPKAQTLLTPAERHTLKLVARGNSNKEIAKSRNVQETTVKNSLHTIYRKLNLKSRVQAAHYYYGNWHLLPSWSPPAFIPLDRTTNQNNNLVYLRDEAGSKGNK